MTPPILSLMLGTAGHVDHGKTSLVKNLTGFDTDRHPEERLRGMSMDFAVAPLDIGDGRIAGIIDVPGHEDFIRNMVAGASAIDLLLLVVAADDGLMAQTEEHVRIVKALGMTEMLVVLTKVDLVDEGLRELVRVEIQAYLNKVGFPNSPILEVSNATGAGMGDLREAISKRLTQIPLKSDDRSFRMPIRQVFSSKGHGLVVTGVPVSGSIGIDDAVEILPIEFSASVRSIQNYRISTEKTAARRSSAINLRIDLGGDEIARGMTLSTPGVYSSTRQAVLWFRNEGSDMFSARKKVLFHSGTLAVLGNVKLIDSSEIAPGREALLFIRFDSPVVLASGDRFVLRHISSRSTYGGGRVLSVNAVQGRKVHEFYLSRVLRAYEAVLTGNYFLAELLAGSRTCFRFDDLAKRSQHASEVTRGLIGHLVESGELLDLGSGAWLLSAGIGEVRQSIRGALERYHLRQKNTWGMKPALVCDSLGLPHESFDRLWKEVLQGANLALKYGRLALSDFEPKISGREIRIREGILREIKKAGGYIAKGNLIAELESSESEIKSVLRLLLDEDLVVQIDTYVLLRSVVSKYRNDLLQLFSEKDAVSIADFRSKTGVSRTVGTLVLESFDAEGLTRRVENARVLVGNR